MRSSKAKDRSSWFSERIAVSVSVLTAAAAVVAAGVSYGSYQLSTRQAEISERALVAANRNIEVAGLLSALRVACDRVEDINVHFFENANFWNRTDFDSSHPVKLSGDDRMAILFVGPTEYPDPNKPAVLADAKALLDSALDLLRRYDLVQLYLTEQESRDAVSADVSAPFKDFADLAYSVVHQELSARDTLENIVAAQAMCISLPKTLAAWFRDSQANKLAYVLKLDDIEFRWAREPLNQRLTKSSQGITHEERDEASEQRASKRPYDRVRDGMFMRLPSPLNP